MTLMNYKKYHKYNMNYISKVMIKDSVIVLKKWYFGLLCLSSGLLRKKHIEWLSVSISKQFKKFGKKEFSFYVLMCFWKFFTKKPLLSRMGKGSGGIEKWMLFMCKGFCLMEISTKKSKFLVYSIFMSSSFKFPLKLGFISLF